MGYEEIFDCEEHWLAVDAWPGWRVPYLLTGELVRQEGWKGDPLETPDPGMTMVEGARGGQGFWSGEEGWSAFSIMLQEICQALDLPLDVVQEVVRDDKWNVTAKYHRVRVGRLSDSGLQMYDAPEGL